MAKNETKRIRPSILQQDRDAFAALQTVSGYAPSNPSYAILQLQTLRATWKRKNKADLDAARDDATAAEWAFHNAVLGAKDQVIAQFGEDSNELQALGLKKKSEFKSPSKKAPKAP
jgi:hypothetical protein